MLWKKTSRYYVDEYDLDGLCTALSNRFDETGGALYMGALLLAETLAEQEDMRDQSVCMALLEAKIAAIEKEAGAPWDSAS